MDFRHSPTGKVIKTSVPQMASAEYHAFVPDPLPPLLQVDSSLLRAISAADSVLGKLAWEGKKLSNPHVLLRAFMAREAVLSSKIEGTQTTIRDYFTEEVGVGVQQNEADLREVKNYKAALDFGAARLKELPLSLRLIREIHEKLMHGVRGHAATPGQFRRTQNWIGAPGSTLKTAKFVPPPPDELMNCLGPFELFLHDRTLPALVHAALCHYQFEAIHPFLDGNGRVGRLLVILLFIEREVLPSPLLYLSAFFEATREEYYHQLYSVSAHGTWHEWLHYFLKGVTLQASDALERTQKVNELIRQWSAIVIKETSSKLPFEIVQQLTHNPFVTMNKVAEQFEVAYTTAARAINLLQAAGIIEQTSEQKRYRLYCATKILEILEAPAKVNS